MKIYLYLAFTLFTFSLSAQLREFHVAVHESDGTSVVQASTEYPDNAMILVYSDLEGLDFRSSVGGINQQRYNPRANRYEILINPQRQILFVAARGFIEKRIALINPGPKQVYYYLVEDRSGQDHASVIFLVEPKDAVLFVDNIPTEINKTVSVKLGEVNVRLEREGYQPLDEALIVTSEQVNYAFEMREVEPEIVHIETNEAHARVIFEGLEKGTTDANKNLSLFLYPGEYTVEVQKNGFLTQSQTIQIKENVENRFYFHLESNSGVIEFNIQPKDATIFLNKHKLGQVTQVLRPPGKYRIDIEMPNFRPQSQTIEISRGERRLVRAELSPYIGSLKFSVKPSNAFVILRNVQGEELLRWEGLHIVRELAAGEYIVEVSSPNHISEKRRFFVVEDGRADVHVELNEGDTSADEDSEKQILLSISRSVQEIESSMVEVKGGVFLMGCSENAHTTCKENEKPAHSVRLDDFSMGKYQITVDQFAAFVSATGYITDAEKVGVSWVWTGEQMERRDGVNWRFDFAGKMRPWNQHHHPVVHVSWNDAVAFCNWLSEITGKNYRLPTEAEWEFAARGGVQERPSQFDGSNSIDSEARNAKTSNSNTHPVGMKKPNELGIYDMIGIVWEWCSDWYGPFTFMDKENPQGFSYGSAKVLRGGGRQFDAQHSRVGHRNRASPEIRNSHMGFRIVRSY